jgi:hypothetical protein
MAIRRTIRTIQSQVGTVILSLEAGRLYAEWMDGGEVGRARGTANDP